MNILVFCFFICLAVGQEGADECIISVPFPVVMHNTLKNCTLPVDITYLHVAFLQDGFFHLAHRRAQYQELDPTGSFAVFSCSSSTTTTENCEEHCVFESGNLTHRALGPHCGGSPEYCSFRSLALNFTDSLTWGSLLGPGTCDSSPVCNCVARRVEYHYEYFHDGADVGVRDPTYANIVVGRNFTKSALSPRSVNDEIIDPEILQAIQNKVLTTTNKKIVNIMCTVAKESYLDSFVVKTGQFTNLNLPLSIYVTSGYLTTSCYVDATLKSRRTFYIVGESMCNLRDCLICWSALEDFSCLPFWQKSFIVVFFIVVFCILLALLPCIKVALIMVVRGLFWIVKFTVLAPFKLQKTNMGKWITAKSMALAASTQNAFSMSDSSEKTDEEKLMGNQKEKSSNLVETELKPTTSEGVSKKNEAAINISPYASFMKVLLFCMIIASAMACDSGAIAQGQITNCVSNGTLETCSVTFSTTLFMTRPGEVACLSLKDERGNIVSHVNVTYTALQVQKPLVLEYYTSDYWVDFASTFRCYKAGHCTSKECADVPVTDGTAYGEIADRSSAHWPGYTKCTRTDQTGEWCFWSTQGCNYHRFGVVPKGNVHKVYSVGTNKVVTPFFHFSSETDQARFETDVAPNRNSVNLFGLIDFSYIGTFDAIDLNTGTKKIILKDGEYFIDEASQKGVCKKGTIGDVQGTTELAFKTQSTVGFLFDDSNIIESISGKYYAATSVFASGISLLKPTYKFPMFLGIDRWMPSNGYLFTNATSPGTVTINLKTSSPITITRTNVNVCPYCTLVSVSGCLECADLSLVIVSCKSQCGEGFVKVTVSDPKITLTTNSIKLTSNPSDFNIRYVTLNKDTSMIMTFTGTGGSNDVKLDYKATTLVDLPAATYKRVLVDGDGNPKPFSSAFADSFSADVDVTATNPVKSWYDRIWVAVVIVGAAIVGIIIIIVLVKIAKVALMTKSMKKD
jgi:hypothetical protein